VAPRGNNDIFTAALDGRLGAVRHLLRTVPGAVASEDGFGVTALHGAADSGRAEICRVLLAARAEMDARDWRGLSALHQKDISGSSRPPEVTPRCTLGAKNFELNM